MMVPLPPKVADVDVDVKAPMPVQLPSPTKLELASINCPPSGVVELIVPSFRNTASLH